MNKINGYTEEEAKNLIDYIAAGKEAGKTLTWLFASYGHNNGRAKGSVRNYYYNLLKERDDDRVVRLLDGKDLRVEEIKEFSEEETDQTLREILAEKSKGMSVRRAIRNIAGEDEKKMLRLQNKYRNVLKKNPERITEMMKEMGMESYLPKKDDKRQFIRRRLETEINALYDRLTTSLKEENERLKEEISRLKTEK